jgi:uncharacterized protein
LLLASLVAKAVEVPYLSGRVNDLAQILTETTFDSLGVLLKDHEIRTTNQVVILTIPSLEDENIEDYAYRVFNDWKLGQKGKDNGVLILVVPNDRKMRIEVGYGLENTLTDLAAARIIQYVMAPGFRDGDYNGGITDGALAVISILEGRGEEISRISEDSSSTQYGFSSMENPDLTIMERILIGAFIFGIIGLFTVLGIFTPGFGWFLYFFLIPFWAMFPVVVLGTRGAFIVFITYLVLYPAAKIFLKNTAWYKKAQKSMGTKGSASIGGFTFSSGSSGGSWSSGSRSSGSSFSGGGGRSGGGGASGGW